MAVNWLDATDPQRPPSLLAWAAELPRAAWAMGELALALPRLGQAPHGDGRPVLVLPGLANGDRSTFVLRRYLQRLGYRSHGWMLGRNFGPRTIGRDADRLIARVESLRRETGARVTLVGISLGGIMARIVAQRRPELIGEVITISAPFAGPATSTNVWRSYQLLAGEKVDSPAAKALLAEAAQPLPVPETALWSRSDGLVNGLNCRGGTACRSIEIRSGHIAVQFRRDVLEIVARLLAAQDRQAGDPGRCR